MTGSALDNDHTTLVETFAEMMKRELAANAHKGNFVQTWHPTVYDLIAETSYHLAKMNSALLDVERNSNQESRKLVDEYAADTANVLAKACQRFGTVVIGDMTQFIKTFQRQGVTPTDQKRATMIIREWMAQDRYHYIDKLLEQLDWSVVEDSMILTIAAACYPAHQKLPQWLDWCNHLYSRFEPDVIEELLVG